MDTTEDTAVLFIGGVGPDVTRETLAQAFAPHANIVAASVIRHPQMDKCIGQAYVTIQARDLDRAMLVDEVGGNAVVVFPVDVDAWVAPPPPQPTTTATMMTPGGAASAYAPPPGPPGLAQALAGAAPAAAAAAAGAATLAGPSGSVGGGGAGATPGGWPPLEMSYQLAGQAPGPPAAAAAAARGMSPMLAGAGGSGYDSSTGLPTSPHANLQAVLNQLRALLAANPRQAFNGKPFGMLLHEVCQKGGMTLQTSDTPEGSAFACTITVARGQAPVCSGRGVGTNKKDAKHNAAAACLDAMLTTGLVHSSELLTAMITVNNPLGGLGAAGGAGMEGLPAASPAAAAATQTQNIMRTGLYPRCAEVMSQLHGTEAGRTKTVLMLLNEYAVRSRMAVAQEESTPAHAALAGPFTFITRLTDNAGNPNAHACGVDRPTKQEAKQASAAAMIEFLLSNGRTTAEALLRGR